MLSYLKNKTTLAMRATTWWRHQENEDERPAMGNTNAKWDKWRDVVLKKSTRENLQMDQLNEIKNKKISECLEDKKVPFN